MTGSMIRYVRLGKTNEKPLELGEKVWVMRSVAAIDWDISDPSERWYGLEPAGLDSVDVVRERRQLRSIVNAARFEGLWLGAVMTAVAELLRAMLR